MCLLRLSSVTKSYRRGHATIDVLRDLSLTVAAGSLVSIYGARGSGKTTLLRIAAGFETPCTGTIARNHTASALAWVHAGEPLMRRHAVATALALPLYRRLGPRAAHKQAHQALASVGLDQYADEHWDTLPNVVRMLCAITFARVRQPLLLIADDPTAGLGTVDRERVCRVLRAAAEQDGLGVLIAVPDLPATLRSHDTMILNRGRLLAAPDDGGGNVVNLAARRSA